MSASSLNNVLVAVILSVRNYFRFCCKITSTRFGTLNARYYLWYIIKDNDMKTQVNTLRSGAKNQVLNPEIDYSLLPKASSHIGHCGTNNKIVTEIWNKVCQENKEKLTISLFGKEIDMKANWSISGKSVSYHASIPFLENFLLTPSKEELASITISGDCSIVVGNGRNHYVSVCPSLITIL